MARFVPISKMMRYTRYLLGAVILAAAVAGEATTQSIVGTWKPGIQHGKLSKEEAETVRKTKIGIANGSLKLHKDKTFGSVLLGKVMFGTYSWDGKTLVLNVKEMVGHTEKQVKAMPESVRVAKFTLKDGKLYSLPLAQGGKPQVVWARKP